MHRSFSPPLTGLLNFPIIEHFKGGEIWGFVSDGERFDDHADLRKLENLLVRSVCRRLRQLSFVPLRPGMPVQFLVACR